MKIPFYIPDINGKDKNAVLKSLGSQWLTGGQRTVDFENKFADYIGVKYAVAVNSCTAALHLAMRALGIHEGDEVIVPTFTFAATANAPIFCGAKPVFADIEEETLNISPASIEKRITKKTKAIIPVHLAGQPCEMSEVLSLALKYNLYVVEDCAHSLGAKYQGVPTGSLSDAGCFSWQTNILTDNGKVKIKSVKVGNKVRTMGGTYEPVMQIFKRKYEGWWVKIGIGFHAIRDVVGKTISLTAEHPILVYRNGGREWIKAWDLKNDDWVYTLKRKCDNCGKEIPIFWQLCECCNPAELPDVREKISKSKDKGNHRESFHFKHYYDDILPYAKELEKQGYRVVPIGVAVPDIIALRDNKVYAYEIEKSLPKKRKLEKYNEETAKYYDDIIWVAREKIKHKNKVKVDYQIEGELLRIKIKSVSKYKRKFPVMVYNLQVFSDPTYFANGFVVHNCYSFYPTKNLTSGEGGMVATNNEALAKYVKLMRSHCMTKEAFERSKSASWYYDVIDLGYNYRMDEMSASLGVSQLERLDEMNRKRAEVAEFYTESLGKVRGIKTPRQPENRTTSHHMYIIRVVEREYGMSRDELFKRLAEKNIECSVHYTPIHLLSFYQREHGCRKGDCPVAEKVYGEVLSLPLFSKMSSSQMEYVVEQIEAIAK
jgi:dTDP-4-amino-4,6-dideoxygalactose transaminase